MDIRNQIYVDRLVEEWDKHGKIILSLDWDSTLSPYETIENQSDIERAKKLVIDCQYVGCYNVIHTACNPNRYDEIRAECNEMGIRVDSINSNPIELPYGKLGSKIYYNHGLCDRHALPAAMDILEDAMVRQRSNKLVQRMDYEGAAG